MTIYLVDVHETVHRCPANPTVAHPIDTRHTIVAITPGGPCRTPVTIRCGDTVTEIPCGQHEPAYRQCAACLTTVWVRRTVVTDLGYQGPATHPAHRRHQSTRSAAA